MNKIIILIALTLAGCAFKKEKPPEPKGSWYPVNTPTIQTNRTLINKPIKK